MLLKFIYIYTYTYTVTIIHSMLKFGKEGKEGKESTSRQIFLVCDNEVNVAKNQKLTKNV